MGKRHVRDSRLLSLQKKNDSKAVTSMEFHGYPGISVANSIRALIIST
jgi:hypothetical protein